MTRLIPVECFSRISGYYRPVQQWNKGKQSEMAERKILKIPVEVKNDKRPFYL